MGRPFYKFQKPNLHILYENGASWIEELGFSESQLKSVLKRTTTKLKKNENYDLLKCSWILYWSVGNGINYYCHTDHIKGILNHVANLLPTNVLAQVKGICVKDVASQ